MTSLFGIQIADIRGQVIENKHSGTEIITLMYSLRSFMLLLGAIYCLSSCPISYYCLREESILFQERARKQEHKEKYNYI